MLPEDVHRSKYALASMGSTFGMPRLADTFSQRFSPVYDQPRYNEPPTPGTVAPGNFHPELPSNHPLRNIRLARQEPPDIGGDGMLNFNQNPL